ncbi:MAG: LD-carboxypeptidase [Flavobacteriaceae bacterium]|nr:MAG: LD-carboxypeptidase [Flavobacteriaceae bacterium]
MKFQTPPYLKKGDSIAIVAPAGVLTNKKMCIEAAKNTAESWGLQVVIGTHVFKQNHHFAGTDEERTADLQKALDNPNIKAIWIARGGYGSIRIIDRLDFTTFKKHPKWIIGYSDVTVLHNHINHLGIETIHGMMPVDFRFDTLAIKKSIATLKKVLFGSLEKYKIPPSKYNRKGVAKGRLTGGNLTLLTAMLGSESAMNTKSAILFIEEIGEYKYHVDRMLQSLKRAGYFSKCNGLIVGDMSEIKKNNPTWGSTVEELILETVSEYDFPVLFGFPAGHEPDNNALILGRNVRLYVEADKLSILSFEE